MGNRRYDEATFRAALADPAVRTMADLCRAVGIVPRGANYEGLHRFARQHDTDLVREMAQRQLGLDEEKVAELRRGQLSAEEALRSLDQPATTRRRQAMRIVLDRPVHELDASAADPGSRRSYSDDQLRAAIELASSFGELCDLLGLSCVSQTRARLRRHAEDIGSPLPAAWSRPGPGPGGVRRRPGRPASTDTRQVPTRPAPTTDELRTLVAAGGCLADVLRALDLELTSSNYAWLRRTFGAHGIDAEHLRWGTRTRAEPLDDVLVAGRPASSRWLRQRLVEEGRREPRCARCRRSSWQGIDIPLELDHIDGDRENNRDENLQLLCPNCHALTPTYRGRNIGRRAPRDASA